MEDSNDTIIDNVQLLPLEILNKICCFLSLQTNICLMCTSKTWKNTITKYGLEGIYHFTNTVGYTYRYYCHFNLVARKMMDFRSLRQISFKLNTITDVIFLQRLITQNRQCLSKICIENVFLKYSCTIINNLGRIIQQKNLENMLKLKCMHFKGSTLNWIIPFVNKFSSVTINDCVLSERLMKKLKLFKSKIKFDNVVFGNINIFDNQFHLQCNHLKIKLNNNVRLNQVQCYHHLLQGEYSIVQCDCNEQILRKILPQSIKVKCHWKIIGFTQMYIFLKKYHFLMFDKFEICSKFSYIDTRKYYKNIIIFAKIILFCDNYKFLYSEKAFIKIKQLYMLLFNLNNMINQQNVKYDNLKLKIKVLNVCNDAGTKDQAKQLITQLKKQFKFFEKLFLQVRIINE